MNFLLSFHAPLAHALLDNHLKDFLLSAVIYHLYLFFLVIKGIEHYILNTNITHESQSVGSYQSQNDGIGYVTYIMTPSYNSFNIDNNGYQTNNEEFGLYVPKGSYAISNNNMYELNRDNPIKGFRGWITLSHSLFDEQTPSYNIKITNTRNLHGLYIINGQKIYFR